MAPLRRGVLSSVVWVSLAMTSRAVPAADPAGGLLGDWGGARTWLVDHGIDLQASYINELASAVDGGPGGTFDADQFYLGGSLDLKRLAAIPDSRILFSFTNRFGTSASLKPGLQTLLEVQEIYGEGNWTRLNQLYWEWRPLGDRLTVKLGRLTGTFDFMPFSCDFQNINFCASIPSHNVAPNWVAFPGGTWAGVVRFAPRPEWYAQLGVYEVNPDLQKHGARFVFGKPFGGPGQRLNAEFGYLPKSAGPGGGYRLGIWHDNVGADDFYWNDQGQPLATYGGTPFRHHQQTGFYAMVQQRVWSQGFGDARGISFFANFIQADRQISLKDQIAELGFFWTGPLALRPQDDLGVAIGRTHVSSRLAARERLYDAMVAGPDHLPVEAVQTAEYPFEVYYSVNLSPAVTLRPNLQLIRAPDGVRDRATLVLVGLHCTILF